MQLDWISNWGPKACLLCGLMAVSCVTESDTRAQALDVTSECYPAGFMGDVIGQSDALNTAWRDNPHTPPRAIRVNFVPGGLGWAGVYWQNRPNNWCQEPGDNLHERSFTKIGFWARGATGDEIVEFKAGGIRNCPGGEYSDSFESRDEIELTTEWARYELDLRGRDLSSVIGCFAWVASKLNNPDGAVFFLDDITYE